MRINGSDHAELAVLGVRAVVVDWLGVVDLEVEGVVLLGREGC